MPQMSQMSADLKMPQYGSNGTAHFAFNPTGFPNTFPNAFSTANYAMPPPPYPAAPYMGRW